MRKRPSGYKFTEKSQSPKGIICFAIAVALVLLYLIFVFLSFQEAGQLSMYYGSVGVLAMISSVVIWIVSITSLFEEDTFKLFPRLAIGISLFAMVLWIGTYILGFMRG